MKRYNVNEIFYSLQGEGSGTGEAAVFVRFFGCNRACPFCDTEQNEFEQLTCEDIAARIKKILIEAGVLKNSPSLRIVLTGGEPTLQIDEELIFALQNEFGAGSKIQIETNGTRLAHIPINVLLNVFLTISPKTLEDALSVAEWLQGHSAGTCKGIEIKLVSSPLYEQDNGLARTLAVFKNIPDTVGRFLQPLDSGDPEENIKEVKKCVRVILSNPKWRLSLQTHKIIGIR